MNRPTFRRLLLDEMDAAARVHRISFDDRLPWLAGLHAPDEDCWYFRERVFGACAVWGAFETGALVGFVAFRPGWVDHLYVLPAAQGRGIGRALLDIARAGAGELSLWTFGRNAAARRFYERSGFIAVLETDGSQNEEREPDVLYRWAPAAGVRTPSGC